MECADNVVAADHNPARNAENIATPSAPQEQSSLDTEEREPQEKVKRTKHTRVHKREKELYGLVTPVFLPLLDARDTSPTVHKEKRERRQPTTERAEDANTTANAEQTASSRHVEKSKEGRKPKKENKDMEETTSGDSLKQSAQVEAAKRTKRLGVKKSALRHKDTPRSRRKRVSLVIDGQTVLPADTVIEPALTSPSSEATSASNSTTSLDELIDPRLTRPDLNHDAVHHSLPLPMSNNHSHFKPLTETPTSSSLVIEAEHSPPSIPVGPPQSATRTFLDPSPSQTQPVSLPPTAGPDPIYPQSASSEALDPEDLVEEDENEPHWDTYVGGLHGSGVDDVDQAGSYGYPSSLGASYLESYMQSRPLSVRMQAADKAGLDEREKRDMLVGRREEVEDKPERGNNDDNDDDADEDLAIADRKPRPRVDDEDEDDMDITGSMEF